MLAYSAEEHQRDKGWNMADSSILAYLFHEANRVFLNGL